MSATVIDPARAAERFRTETRERVRALGRPLRVLGLLSRSEGPAHVYAQYAQRGTEAVGIEMELRRLPATEVRDAVLAANADEGVDGLFLYYPLTDPVQDRWLRELVDPRKDVEGMHSFWSRLLYENRRHLDEARTRRAIVPCTPLAILKLLEETPLRPADGAPTSPAPTSPAPTSPVEGAPSGPAEGTPSSREGHAPLAGVRACVINRSEVVGRPLSAMLANDGAEVVSLDLDGSVVFDPAIGRHTHSVRDAQITRAEALAGADLVVTGVPSRDFPLVRGEEIRPGAVCVNFSQYRNFDDSVLDVASAFVPRVGPMTVTMATRNLVRLAEQRDG